MHSHFDHQNKTVEAFDIRVTNPGNFDNLWKIQRISKKLAIYLFACGVI